MNALLEKKIGYIIFVLFQGVKIAGFSVRKILREINFWEYSSIKTAFFFAILGVLTFV